MILRHRRVVLVTRCDAEEHELARDLLLEEREVFSDSDRWAQAKRCQDQPRAGAWAASARSTPDR